jgi:hypothetical protein
MRAAMHRRRLPGSFKSSVQWNRRGSGGRVGKPALSNKVVESGGTDRQGKPFS